MVICIWWSPPFVVYMTQQSACMWLCSLLEFRICWWRKWCWYQGLFFTLVQVGQVLWQMSHPDVMVVIKFDEVSVSEWLMILSIMVPTKPVDEVGVCLCLLCDGDNVECLWVDFWWSGCDLWMMLMGLMMLVGQLQWLYQCAGGKMSFYVAVVGMVIVSSSSLGEMKCGIAVFVNG